MNYYQAEYDKNTKHYLVYNLQSGKVEHVFTSKEMQSFIKDNCVNLLGGKNVIKKVDIPSMNAKGYTFENGLMKIAVGIDIIATEEIEKMDNFYNKLKILSQTTNVRKNSRLKPWVKGAMATVVLAGGIAGAVVLNQGPDFSVPIQAQEFSEYVTERMESDNLDPDNEKARETVINQMYSTESHEEVFYRTNLDNVTIAIKNAEQNYEDKKITKEEAEKKVSEVKEYYKNLVQQYEDYRVEQNQGVSLK